MLLPSCVIVPLLWLAAAVAGPSPEALPPAPRAAAAVLPAFLLPTPPTAAPAGRRTGRGELGSAAHLSGRSSTGAWSATRPDRADADIAAATPFEMRRRLEPASRPALVTPPSLAVEADVRPAFDWIELPLTAASALLPSSSSSSGARARPTMRRWESGVSSREVAAEGADHGDCWHAWGCREHREPLLDGADGPLAGLVTPTRAEAVAEAVAGAVPEPIPDRPRGEEEFEVHWARDASGRLSTYIYGRRQDEQAVAEAFGRRIEGRAGIQFQPQAGTDCRLQVAQEFVNRFEGLDEQLNLSLQVRLRF